ncbi:GyrI-like domain-containing protein [Dyella sp. C11]|uniref:AraC family transcriptional regulator n=1 Tax=Dyella sp. C11 TaxID=2126991 RepID=UPI0018E4E722|nr:GyrI-like domain-containing protein [Dyella sp. C11]
MKANTREDYLRRIDRVVALLQSTVERGGELPDLAVMAAAAHLSPFHFHRIYRALSGETVGQTVTRLRLMCALSLLQRSAGHVTEVALTAGYETPQSFARAVRQVFDATPSELRGEPDRLHAAIERLRHPALGDRMSQTSFAVEVVSVQPFQVVATRHEGDHRGLDESFGRLFAWAADHGLLERVQGIYGVAHDTASETVPDHGAFDCALAFAGDDVATDAFTYPLSLGGGCWARWRHVGTYDGLGALTDQLIAHWLPGSGHVLRDQAPFRHFLDDPEETPVDLLRADVYLPVEPC